LRAAGITADCTASLLAERHQLMERVNYCTSEPKLLKEDMDRKRKALSAAKAALKKIQSEKTKLDIPIVASVENIFLNYSISPAAYHGGKLNGVDCQEVMKQAKTLFADIISLLLYVSNPDRCTDDVITSNCELFRDICVTLDTVSSKMRIQNGLPTQEDFITLQCALKSGLCMDTGRS
jgi:hypothetical protein